MKILLLRGQVPKDRDPKEILFDKIEDCDDIYLSLVHRMAEYSQVWYWGAPRKFPLFWDDGKMRIQRQFGDGFKYVVPPVPPMDVVWARGGFGEFNHVINLYPKAFKIYYGAGKRYLPDRNDYNLILVDSREQQEKAQTKFPKSRVELWFKPAPDNLIPAYNPQKIYDVCYVANGTQAKIKGIKWVYKTVPKNIKMLHLGLPSKYVPPKNVTRKRVVRKDVFHEMKQCKVGIIPYDSIDSCPRAMVEMLACGLPVIALDTVRFWRAKYSYVDVGTKSNFWDKVQEQVSYSHTGVAENYRDKLSLDKCAEYLKELIGVP